MSLPLLIEEMLIRSITIRDETVTNANTATRVGTLFKMIVESLESLEDFTDDLELLIPEILATEFQLLQMGPDGIIYGIDIEDLRTKLTEDLVVSNPVGTLGVDEVIPAGTDLEQILKRMLVEQSFPTGVIEFRDISNCESSLVVEIGDTILSTEVIKLFYNLNGAEGNPSAYAVREVAGELDEPVNVEVFADKVEASEPADYLPESDANYTILVNFPSNGKFPLGFTLIRSFTVKPRRACFFKAESIATSPVNMNSAFVRSLEKTLNVRDDEMFQYEVPAGTQQVVFAYPSSLGLIKQITNNGEPISIDSDEDEWIRIDVNVEGLNGYASIPYYLYYWNVSGGLNSNRFLEFKT